MYSTVSVRHRVARVFQRQRRLVLDSQCISPLVVVGVYWTGVHRTWSTTIVIGTPPASTAVTATNLWLTWSSLFATRNCTAPNVMRITLRRAVTTANKSSEQVRWSVDDVSMTESGCFSVVLFFLLHALFLWIFDRMPSSEIAKYMLSCQTTISPPSYVEKCHIWLIWQWKCQSVTMFIVTYSHIVIITMWR